jgi:hypothetical protein
MANKKTKKKPKKLKAIRRSKTSPAGEAAKKKLAKKKAALKKSGRKTKTVLNLTANKKTTAAAKKRVPARGRGSDGEPFELPGLRSPSGEQSGDLQGLSNVESADSESVDELLEEGNAFEADVVSGVEDAGDDGVKEVRTHEVPEDDVPGEYLDEE